MLMHQINKIHTGMYVSKHTFFLKAHCKSPGIHMLLVQDVISWSQYEKNIRLRQNWYILVCTPMFRSQIGKIKFVLVPQCVLVHINSTVYTQFSQPHFITIRHYHPCSARESQLHTCIPVSSHINCQTTQARIASAEQPKPRVYSYILRKGLLVSSCQPETRVLGVATYNVGSWR